MKYYKVLNDLITLQDKYQLDAYNYTELNNELVLIAEEAILVDELTKFISNLETKLDKLKKEKLTSPYKLKLVVDNDNYKEYFWNDQLHTYKVVVNCDNIKIFNECCIWNEDYRKINYYQIKEVINKDVLEALVSNFTEYLELAVDEENKSRYSRNLKELQLKLT